MRRVLLVLSLAALVVAVMVATAMPAFAKVNCTFVDNPDEISYTCAGGFGHHETFPDGTTQSGGQGGRTSTTCDPLYTSCSFEGSGGGGGHTKTL
jgi:hypothetical protein